ncbi:pimeloyl-ACP methyl ester carboxylesterase [Microvirga lupini]|uniref:Pimeloyl-ACP methyl ester carboxylesterase n=1 Tax=Microvirga lupini TaxID=420324 RepID=A0A7W4VQZ9_9HYPH|nr:alpha/beta hydrolase [Microvirga lupini]MBB3021436.1 pimeloyl-ACP methyl ester carboxylesterase [Microvirga lupini]
MTLLLVLAAPFALLILGAAFTYLYAWSIERRFPPTGRFIEVEGCRIHYRDEGPKETPPRGTIVILHGASSNLVESMLGMGAALARRYRVIAIDRPGHGWSERKPGLAEADPARQAALMAGALRQLAVSNAVIVGHSWSGSIVPRLALDHADVTGAIVVLSGITTPWPGGTIGWYRRLIDSWAGWLWFRTLAVPILLVLRPWMKKKTFWPQRPPKGIVTKGFIPLAFRPRAYEVNMQDFAVMYDGVLKQSGRYKDIRLPTLVIAGDADEIVWTDLHSRCFAREVPDAELILMPGIGHMPQYADQETVLSAIEILAARVVAPAREDVDHA